MIKNIRNKTIDLGKVVRVGSVGGDPSWLRCTVYFVVGKKIEIYEKRMDGLLMKSDEKACVVIFLTSPCTDIIIFVSAIITTTL